MDFIKRFQRIKSEFGGWVFFRIALMLVALVGFAALDVFYLSKFIIALVSVGGLLVGFLLRKQIPEGFDYYSKIISVGLFIYGIVLFLGDRFGIGNYWKLFIIALTTVVIFDLQFWSLSDSSVFNKEKIDENEA